MKYLSTRLGLLTALAAASLAFSPGAKAAADTAYNSNDLLLFFQNPTGTTGSDRVVTYSLGSTFDVFRRAATPSDPSFGNVINLGNINSILTSTYGTDWSSRAASIFAGAAGQNGSPTALATTTVNGDFARTVYLTKPRTDAGTLGEAASAGFTLPGTSTAQSALANNIAVSNSNAGNTTQPGALQVNDTIIDAQNPFFNGAPATAYGQIPAGIMGSLSDSFYTLGSVSNIVLGLDLYRATPTLNGDGWQDVNGIEGVTARAGFYIGTVTISANGDVNFVPANVNGEGPNPLAPVINSALTADATLGQPFSYQITATNQPSSFGATGLPAGLSVNSSTGLISGSPTADGVFNVQISATNAEDTGSATLVLTVTAGPQPPSITSEIGIQSFAPGSTAALTVGATGTDLQYQWFFNGRPLRGATNPTLDVAVSTRTVGRYSVRVSNAFGDPQTSFGILTSNDAGLLVYSLRGTSNMTDGSTETFQRLNGFLLIDRTNGANRVALVNLVRVGRASFYALEDFTGVAYHTTGPVVGSRSVLAGSISSGTFPNIEIETFWLSGLDRLAILSPTEFAVAPPAFNGVIGMLTLEDGVAIDNYNVTAVFDRRRTGVARQQPTFEAALQALLFGLSPLPQP